MKKVNNIDILELAKQKKTAELVFVPAPNMRAAKAKFWKRIDFDASLADAVSAASIVQITNEPRVTGWWNQKEFQEWFLNKEEANERIEYLYMLWMDKAEELLLDPMANHNAIVQLGKIISQLSGRGEQEKVSDENIQKMTKQQLQAYIQKLAPKLLAKAAKEESKDDSNETKI